MLQGACDRCRCLPGGWSCWRFHTTPVAKALTCHVLHVPHPCACRYAFFDTDNVIERAHPGETVSDIFKKYGEDYFRQCEEQVGPQEGGGQPEGRGLGFGVLNIACMHCVSHGLCGLHMQHSPRVPSRGREQPVSRLHLACMDSTFHVTLH
jgi:hypothetical protein